MDIYQYYLSALPLAGASFNAQSSGVDLELEPCISRGIRPPASM